MVSDAMAMGPHSVVSSDSAASALSAACCGMVASLSHCNGIGRCGIILAVTFRFCRRNAIPIAQCPECCSIDLIHRFNDQRTY